MFPLYPLEKDLGTIYGDSFFLEPLSAFKFAPTSEQNIPAWDLEVKPSNSLPFSIFKLFLNSSI